ncbi:hypothetical protein SDC9_89298 [bioreactor metagenome]|uniref:SLH domain-containing protein n=1 Tax=bioreactor metagenome TaxID=1076179 RepID=A0A644ZRW3_9ZZZZ
MQGYSKITFTAHPPEGYTVKQWKLGSSVITGDDGLVLTGTEYCIDKLMSSVAVTVTFNAPVLKTLISVSAPADIAGIRNGALKTEAGLGLPAQVTLVTDAGSVQADVSWDLINCSYDPSVTSEQNFTVDGIITLPSNVVNTNSVDIGTSVNVTVDSADTVYVTGVSLDKAALSLTANGSTGLLTATVAPSDAANKNVTWSSSDTDVATVSGGTVTPVAEGHSTITVRTKDGGFEATCLVTVAAEAGGSSGGDGGAGGGLSVSGSGISIVASGGRTTAIISASAGSASGGIAPTGITGAQITSAIAGVLADASENGCAEAAVEINVASDSSADGFSVTIPGTSFDALADSAVAGLTVETPIGSVTFGKEAIESISGSSSGDIAITIKKADTSGLSEEARTAIGTRPVYDFTVSSGGTAISDFGGGTAVVSVPYTLAEGENPDKIVIYCISDSGELVMMPGCVYDSETGTVTFATNHFSHYAVAYHDVSFSDVSGWCEPYVNYLAARGVLKGSGDGTFKPEATITRAQFVTILARLSGDDLSGYTTSSFTDVSTADWYFPTVEWAYENGIVMGSNGAFDPEANITRQDLVVIIARYTRQILRCSLTGTSAAVAFTDSKDIASYASEAVEAMQRSAIISGNSDGSFAPMAYATRAEASKMIALLLQTWLNNAC